MIATRLSLLRANIHKNRALQIGNLDSDSTKQLLKSEQELLIRLSEAARDSQKSQVALNSITRANNGALQNEFHFAQEFASVMWTQQEQKMAVEFLKQFLARPVDKRTRSPEDLASAAQLLSLVVSLFFFFPLMTGPFLTSCISTGDVGIERSAGTANGHPREVLWAS